jgi:subfamily B ATP-binding cassette protein HlyB/CyaB
MSKNQHVAAKASLSLSRHSLLWTLGSFCRLIRHPFDAELLIQHFPPPYTTDTLVHASRALGLKIQRLSRRSDDLNRLPSPFLIVCRSTDLDEHELRLVIKNADGKLVCLKTGSNTGEAADVGEINHDDVSAVFLLRVESEVISDPDLTASPAFGFRWFLPELLKYSRVWRDVLLASLALQLLALATPLFTQVIIDKVIVHRAVSTLVVMAAGLIIFMLFSALLGWSRQTLLHHTGNRVDAVLGMSVFRHLFSVPIDYFARRPTGVITTRLQGVETIREFIASAAVSLLLDIPFLLLFVALMFWYSLPLTLITLAILTLILALSIVLAPLFRAQLNEQFLIGARNQAFLTEYVAGIETVKSMQMEAQLNERYSGYLGEYLQATFKTRQLGNLYNTLTAGLEQLMRLLILLGGAYIAMHSTEFTIGMLVAFQMFAGNLSAPAMRLVGLWQQLQQARLAVQRLADVMDAPSEPHSVMPSRKTQRRGLIIIEKLAFRYSERHPWLYKDFDLTIAPGHTIALMGQSGCGKSTLARLLQGFHLPQAGRIQIDGIDSTNLPMNELRRYFGVVPQETVLFSGTLLQNLQLADPHASFERIVTACVMAGIHDTLEQLPDGYQTIIGERGIGLSGGQRQRIAIARALLRQPYVLIFDEATSALDIDTARQLAQTINGLKGKVSVLFIAHALPEGLWVDQVLHLGGDQRNKTTTKAY